MGKHVFVFLTVVAFFFSCNMVFAKSTSPPFKKIKIYGKTAKRFNKVSLFRSGKSKKPFKTMKVTSGGKYSLTVSIPKNMKKGDGYYYTDMRFWNDDNNNGVKDNGESISQCHFITWYPSYKKVVMRIYDGPTHEIKSSKFKYNYK